MHKQNLNINVEYLTRVEGHGNIVVNVKEGKLEACRLDVVEAPRFFEGMLRGRSVFEAQHITSRICGICARGDTLASIQAAEDALGVIPTEQTMNLRKLLLHLEILTATFCTSICWLPPIFWASKALSRSLTATTRSSEGLSG